MTLDDLDKEIADNRQHIVALAEGIKIAGESPTAKDPIRRAEVSDLQDRLLFRLKELELHGQRDKIATMQRVVAVLTGKS